MKRINRLLSVVLSIILLLNLFTPIVGSATEIEPTITIEKVNGVAGKEVQVDIAIKDNPGIVSPQFTVNFDEGLTLIAADAGEVFSMFSFTKPNQLKNGQSMTSVARFMWSGDDVAPEDIQDGVILTLTFTIDENAENNQAFGITLTGEFNDSNLNTLDVNVVPGSITVLDYAPGDVDDDGDIDSRDVTMICRYIIDGCTYDPYGYAVSIREEAADVNDDGAVTSKDVTMICRYIVDGCVTDPNGYNITLLPSTPKCSHTMETISYKAATCTEDGNPVYYHCTTCDKYYNDTNGTGQLTTKPTIPATGHNEVPIPAVEPTYDSVGWTEGSECNICGTVLVEPIEIPMLDKQTVNVQYRYEGINPGDYLKEYVAQHEQDLIANNEANPTEINTTEKGHTFQPLDNLSIVPGYTFKGWVDGYGNPVTSVAQGEEASLILYANWQVNTYWVTFNCPDDLGLNFPEYNIEDMVIPDNSVIYTVENGLKFKNYMPELPGYTFVGWSNSDGFLINEVKPGTIGTITVQANWTANRNIATSYQNYGDPIIIEDAANGQFLFVYNIGKIENVPLNEIEGSYFELENGATRTFNQELTVTDTIDESFVNTINEMVSNATTKSSGWTLSSEWNDLYTSTEETGSLSERSDERTTSDGSVVGGKYFVSNSEGGSTYVSTESGGSSSNSSKITTEDSVGINQSYDESTEKYCDAELGVKTHLGATNETELSAGVEVPVSVAKVSAGVKNTTTVEASLDTESSLASGRKDNTAYHIDGSYSGYVGTVNTGDTSSYYNSTASNSSNWNSQTGYEQSKETSHNEAVTEAIKEQLSQTTTHSISKALGGENSQTSAIEDTSMSSEEYSTTLTYSKGSATTTSKTVEDTFTLPGYYRYITAGTVHVYAVVGYDVATASYYTYSFNVLDDKTRQIWDYSKTSMNFDDCENGVVTFDVPYEVNEYVAGMVGKSDGLEISYDGEVTGFEPSENFDGTVVIPQYDSKNNQDGSYSAVKVTSFSETAFANVKEDIKIVVLPMYITEIPDNAFAGCTNLETVIAYGVTEIGDNAFAGCTSLKKFYVDNAITSLGDNAFEDVPEVAITAYDSAVADAAINCGAKRISLNISYITDSYDNTTVNVPDSTDYFALIGNGSVYNNVTIKSDAGETMVSNMVFANNTGTPIELTSANVTLARVTVENAPGFAVMLKANDVQLNLLGNIQLTSSSNHAVISKAVTLGKADSSTTSKLVLDGNYLVCGDITNTSMLTFTNGEIIYITEEEYESMLTSSVVAFDPNGGAVDVTEKTVYYGQSYGDLPIPTRTGYSFNGWYTAQSGGTLVTADTVVRALANQTLYAQWTAMAYNVSWNTGTGYTIAVNRTSSPYANAATGALSNGAVVYYGDVLDVVYTNSDYYTITDHGAESITVTDNLTASHIYASAKQNDISGWVLASEVPEDAQVIAEKWTYDLTTNITSDKSSVDGYTLYKTTSAWSDYGSWSSWSDSAYYASDSRQVETQEVVASYNYKTIYHYYRYANNARSAGESYWTSTYCNWEEITLDSPLTATSGSGYKYYCNGSILTNHGACNGSNYHTMWPCNDNGSQVVVSTNYITQYRYRDRYLIYTYYHTKTEEMESATEVTATDTISNVQKWVQYRTK